MYNNSTFLGEIAETTQDDKLITSLLKIFDISEKVTEVLCNHPELYASYENSLNEIFGSESDSPMDAACNSLKLEILKDTSAKSFG